MKKRSLRVLAVVMSTALLLAFMPALHLAADTVCSQVNSGLFPPIGGYSPYEMVSPDLISVPGYPYDFSVDIDALCAATESPTLDGDDWVLMDNDEAFEAGWIYAFYVTVGLTSEGYTFDPNVTVFSPYGGTVTLDKLGTDYLTYWVVFDEVYGFPANSCGIALGDTVVTEENASDILGDGTASFDPQTRKLTLDGTTINSAFSLSAGARAGLYAMGNVTVEIAGTCTIDLSGLDKEANSSLGIAGDSVLTLVGDGDLSVHPGDAGNLSCGISAGENLSLQVGGNWFIGCGKVDEINPGACSCALYSCGVFLEPTRDVVNLTLAGNTDSIVLEGGSVELYDFTVTAGETPSATPHDVDAAVFAEHFADYTFACLIADPNPTYTLYVCDVEVTSWNEDDIFGDGTAAYNPKTHTLTLEDATIDNAARIVTAYGLSFAAIYAEQPLTIDLIGNNEIDLSALPYPADTETAFLVLSDSTRLSLIGDGNLTATAGNADPSTLHYGLACTYDIDISMTGDLEISAPYKVAFGAICALNGLLRMELGGDVFIHNGSSTSADRTDAIFANYDIELVNHGNAVIQTGDHTEDNIALLANHAIRIVNDGDLSIGTGNMASENCNIAIKAPYAISILNAGTLDISTGDATMVEDANCYGIKSDGNVRIVNHSTMTVTTGNADRDSDALEIEGTLRLLGSGTLDVSTGDARYTSAVYFPTLIIGGDGAYTFSTGQASSWSGAVCGTGIRIEDDVTVTVNASGCTNGDVIGINAYEEGLLIGTTGDVIVSVGDAGKGEDCRADGIYTGEAPLYLYGEGDVFVSVGGAYNSYGASCGMLLIASPANVSFVASDDVIHESIGVHATIDDSLFQIFVIFGTDPGNVVYFEGATCAMNAQPLFDTDSYIVQGSTVLPAEMKQVILSEAIFPDLKALAFTGIEPPEGPSEAPSEEPISEPVSEPDDVSNVSEPSNPAVIGDADGDGTVTMKDVLLARKFIANMIGEGDLDLAGADADGDGTVTMKDVLLMRKIVAGLT